MESAILNNIKITPERQKLIVYIVLTIVTFSVFWQVNRFDFVNFDDQAYIIQNSSIQNGITPDGLRWAFSTKYFGLWNPLVWLSLMADYRLFGLNAGGYHLNNLILHLLSTLLLFWLLNRMTGTIWKSAFVATFFALHPLHVESVAWISERKDVLSAFFWMLTLCLYVYYTERPAAGRYAAVLLCFICALMSKPMVVTLPVIMILLDYWPLKRFEFQKGRLPSLILKEKLPFFILSAILVFLTLYSPDTPGIKNNPDLQRIPLLSGLSNAPVAFVTYLGKTFWPHDLTIFYPFPEHIPLRQVLAASFLIIMASITFIILAKRRPPLFVGWFWLIITIAPVIGIIQISLSTPYAMADRYHYLPSIGIAILLAWGIPALTGHTYAGKIIAVTTAIVFLALTSVLSWKQCGYWQNSISLWTHALNVTGDNYVARCNRGAVYSDSGRYQLALEDYNMAVKLQPLNFQTYYNRGNIFNKLHLDQEAIENYNEAIRLKSDYADAYYNRGTVYNHHGRYQSAIEDFNKVISLKKNYADAYNNRGAVYFKLGQYQQSLLDFNEAIRLKPDDADAYNNRGGIRFRLGQYQSAIDDFNTAIHLKPDNADAIRNRKLAYLKLEGR